MSKRILLCLFLLATAIPAHATDFTDIWWIPAESGWGANVVESDNFLFVTFFIYGADNKPTWFSANLTLDSASGNFNGPLNANTGTYYGAPWNPNNGTQVQVGTASFQPTGPYTANLIYVVTNGPTAITVTKAIQRQTLTAIGLGGTYTGGQAGGYSGSNCTSLGAYTDTFGFSTTPGLTVAQSTSGTVTFTFNYDGLGTTCILAGTLTQIGQLYNVANATYKCAATANTPALNTTATMSEIKATGQGIEGTFSAANSFNGCRENAAFSAVFLQ
jgi:hypothetical protein